MVEFLGGLGIIALILFFVAGIVKIASCLEERSGI